MEELPVVALLRYVEKIMTMRKLAIRHTTSRTGRRAGYPNDERDDLPRGSDALAMVRDRDSGGVHADRIGRELHREDAAQMNVHCVHR